MSALLEVIPAAITAANGHAGFVAEIGGNNRVFAGGAPATTSLPYMTTGTVTEEMQRRFGGGHYEDSFVFHIFVQGVNAMPALRIYHELEEALAAPLALASFEPCRVRLSIKAMLVETERNSQITHLHVLATCLAI